MRQRFLLLLYVGCTHAILKHFSNQSPFNIDEWTQNDLVEYVSDQVSSLKEIKSETYDDMKEQLLSPSLLLSHLQLKNSEPWWKFWAKDYSLMSNKQSSDISGWFFDSWSATQLHQLLDQHHINCEPQASKEVLLAKVKENFDDIRKSLKVSGYYPSSTFFQGWSVSDIQTWLKEQGIEYSDDIKDKKDKLIHLVKKNIYHASRYAEEKRLETLQSLVLSDEPIFDKSGKLIDTIFEHWSNVDIKNWLEFHKIPVDLEHVDKHKYLLNLANKNIELLKNDISWYTERMEMASSPYIIKPANYIASLLNSAGSRVHNAIPNGLHNWFCYSKCSKVFDVSNWTRDRLKSYLDVRNVKYHTLSTTSDLRQLAHESRHKPIVNLEKHYSKLFNKIPLKKFQNWIHEQTNLLQKKGKDASDMVDKKLDQISKESQVLKGQLIEKWYKTLDSWSTDELITYLKSFGIVIDPSSTKDELVEMVKRKSEMFFGYPKSKPFYKKWLDNISLRN